MPVSVEQTPNPNAMKFVVGRPVGGPATVTSAEDADEQWLKDVFGAGHVQQVFLTADFVTVTKTEDVVWDAIIEDVLAAVRSGFEA